MIQKLQIKKTFKINWLVMRKHIKYICTSMYSKESSNCVVYYYTTINNIVIDLKL